MKKSKLGSNWLVLGRRRGIRVNPGVVLFTIVHTAKPQTEPPLENQDGLHIKCYPGRTGSVITFTFAWRTKCLQGRPRTHRFDGLDRFFWNSLWRGQKFHKRRSQKSEREHTLRLKAITYWERVWRWRFDVDIKTATINQNKTLFLRW